MRLLVAAVLSSDGCGVLTLSTPANTCVPPSPFLRLPQQPPHPACSLLSQVDADTVKGVANRFILDQDIAIAAMGDTQMLPGRCWPPAGPDTDRLGWWSGLGAREMGLRGKGGDARGVRLMSSAGPRPPPHPLQTTTGCGAAPTG